MLKKKYNIKKQLILKYNFKKLYLISLIINSFKCNHFLEPIIRLSFFAQESTVTDIYFRFATFQTLICLISLSTKVSDRGFFYSRFFLNKQLDSLSIANTLK